MSNSSVVLPRTVFTFNRLPEETTNQSINRFIYAILTNENIKDKFIKHILLDVFSKDPESEITTGWPDIIPRFIEDSELDSILLSGD